MFHTPNINLTTLQAQALRLPLVTQVTEGNKEEELADLEQAINQAVKQFHLEGIVTGAVESVYQSERVQRICHSLDLWCFNPLWKKNQKVLLEELIIRGFKVIISGIFAYPLDGKWLGKQIDTDIIHKLIQLQSEYGISPSGEGGEIETTVLDAPLFQKRIKILSSKVETRGNSGVLRIEQAWLAPK